MSSLSSDYPCTIVIGFISFILNLGLSLISYLNLVRLNRESEINESEHVFNESTFREFDQFFQMEDNTDMLKRLQIGTLIYSLIMTPCSIPMIIGMKEQKPYWVTPWIILSAIGIIAMACNVVITGNKLTSSQIFSEIFYIVVQSLLWIPVFILWSELRYTAKSNWQRIEEDIELYYIPVPVALLSGGVCRCKQQKIGDTVL